MKPDLRHLSPADRRKVKAVIAKLSDPPEPRCKNFSEFLVRMTERLDEEAIKEIISSEGWVGVVSSGKFPH